MGGEGRKKERVKGERRLKLHAYTHMNNMDVS